MKAQNKEIKDICCKGRLPENRQTCDAVLYQTDGEFLYVNGLVLNRGQGRQRIECSICSYVTTWDKSPKYRNMKSLNANKFQRKF